MLNFFLRNSLIIVTILRLFASNEKMGIIFCMDEASKLTCEMDNIYLRKSTESIEKIIENIFTEKIEIFLEKLSQETIFDSNIKNWLKIFVSKNSNDFQNSAIQELKKQNKLNEVLENYLELNAKTFFELKFIFFSLLEGIMEESSKILIPILKKSLNYFYQKKFFNGKDEENMDDAEIYEEKNSTDFLDKKRGKKLNEYEVIVSEKIKAILDEITNEFEKDEYPINHNSLKIIFSKNFYSLILKIFKRISNFRDLGYEIGEFDEFSKILYYNIFNNMEYNSNEYDIIFHLFLCDLMPDKSISFFDINGVFKEENFLSKKSLKYLKCFENLIEIHKKAGELVYYFSKYISNIQKLALYTSTPETTSDFLFQIFYGYNLKSPTCVESKKITKNLLNENILTRNSINSIIEQIKKIEFNFESENLCLDIIEMKKKVESFKNMDFSSNNGMVQWVLSQISG